MSLRTWLSRVWNGPPPPPAPAVVRKPITVRSMARDGADQRSFRELYAPAPTPPGVPAAAQKMAMDYAGVSDAYAYGGGLGWYGDGAAWPGFAYLAELTQRPEYRLCAEVWAKEMTREWIELVHDGDDPDEDKLAELNAELVKFDVRAIMRTAKEHDGFFGAGQIYVDTGLSDDAVLLRTPMILDAATFKKGSLKALHVVEPFWTYPNGYESLNPLKRGYYEPVTWFVQGNVVHRSRLLRIVSREMPDILKPAYAFAGLSLSQAVRPYIDNWLRTRQSVSDLTHSFSVMVLKTILGSQLGAPEQDNLNTRVDWASQTADNKGWWIIDKETEEIENIAVPIAGLDKLQAQALEQICAISQIPKVKLLGLDPGGLNACLTGDTLIFTDRGDVPIRDVTVFDKVLTREGFAPLTFSGLTKHATDLVEIKTAGSTLRCTDNHPIWIPSIGEFVRAENVRVGDRLLLIGEKPDTPKMRRPWHGADNGGGNVRTDTTPRGTLYQNGPSFFIGECGRSIADQFQLAFTFITSTKTKKIISSQILSLCTQLSTAIITTSEWILGSANALTTKPCAAFNAEATLSFRSFQAERNSVLANAYSPIEGRRDHESQKRQQNAYAKSAERRLKPFVATQSFARSDAQHLVETGLSMVVGIFGNILKNIPHAPETNGGRRRAVFPKNVDVVGNHLFRAFASMKNIALSVVQAKQKNKDLAEVLSVRFIRSNEPVYDLTVANGYLPEFFANDILTHNSSDGEIRVFYDNVKAQQEHDFAPILKNILDILQMNLWGKVDPAISFRFISLWQLDEAAQASVRKTDADTDAVYIEAGVISNEEARDKLRNDKKSGYDGLEGPAPEMPEMQEPDDSGDPAKGAEPRGEERDGT